MHPLNYLFSFRPLFFVKYATCDLPNFALYVRPLILRVIEMSDAKIKYLISIYIAKNGLEYRSQFLTIASFILSSLPLWALYPSVSHSCMTLYRVVCIVHNVRGDIVSYHIYPDNITQNTSGNGGQCNDSSHQCERLWMPLIIDDGPCETYYAMQVMKCFEANLTAFEKGFLDILRGTYLPWKMKVTPMWVQYYYYYSFIIIIMSSNKPLTTSYSACLSNMIEEKRYKKPVFDPWLP